jgi:hypothetical protein
MKNNLTTKDFFDYGKKAILKEAKDFVFTRVILDEEKPAKKDIVEYIIYSMLMRKNSERFIPDYIASANVRNFGVFISQLMSY